MGKKWKERGVRREEAGVEGSEGQRERSCDKSRGEGGRRRGGEEEEGRGY